MFFTDTASSFIAHQLILSGTVALNSNESLTDQPNQDPWGCDAPPGTITAVIFKNGKVDEFGGPRPCFTQYGTIADTLDAKRRFLEILRLKHEEAVLRSFRASFGTALMRSRKIRYGLGLEDEYQLAEYQRSERPQRTARFRRCHG